MIRSSFQKLFIFSFISPLLFQSAAAFDIPEPNGFVTDLAQVFSYEEEMAIEVRIQEIEENTTAEIGLLVIPTTDGEAISSVAFDVGNLWGVGKKKNDNGLVIVIATQDRDWFMATGYGLEGALPDAITKRIAENNFPPHFREGNYADGVLDALDDIEGYLKKDPSVISAYENSHLPDSSDGFAMWITILIVFAIAKSIWVGASNKKKRIGRSVTGTALLFFLALATTMLVVAAVIAGVSALIDLIIIAPPATGGGSSGSSPGGSSWSSHSSSSSSSGSSSGSGGSFGGGSFGGGGSGGRW